MTIRELIDALSAYPPDEKVVATWESIFREVSVYRAANGVVILDADDDGYKAGIMAGDKSYLIPPR